MTATAEKIGNLITVTDRARRMGGVTGHTPLIVDKFGMGLGVASQTLRALSMPRTLMTIDTRLASMGVIALSKNVLLRLMAEATEIR